MRDINIRDIIELVIKDADDIDEIIEKSFDWYYERTMAMIKGMVGLAITIFIALLISHFKNEIHANDWEVYTAFISPFILLAFGIYRFWRIRRLSKQYFYTIGLYKSILQISNFLKLYEKR